MNRSPMGFAVTAFLTVIAHSGFAGEPTHVPATALAATNAELIARADRAWRDYVVACSTGDTEALVRSVTSDAVAEYELEERGTYFKVEAAAQIACLSAKTRPTGVAARISKLWIFPTPESNVVFVRYTLGSDDRSAVQVQDTVQLAIVEMRGNRIFRIRIARRSR
ncbi:MAG TPA: hypothetical protein VK624_20815 [Steroidobacteraceae bacterium]|nr:hypothetical protein [Steroidobacteraceae bacterium]